MPCERSPAFATRLVREPLSPFSHEIRRVCDLPMARAVNPALPAHQPDDSDAGGDGDEAGDAQRRLWHRLHLLRQLLGEIRHKPVENPFKHEHEPYRIEKIVQTGPPATR